MLEVEQDVDQIPNAALSIAEAARRTGVSAHTLRYYERAGLVVTPVDRTHGGRRRYHKLDIEWITICTKLRATSMPIKGIRRYAELVTAGSGNEDDRLDLLESHRDRVLAQIAELHKSLEMINHKINVYKGHGRRRRRPAMGAALTNSPSRLRRAGGCPCRATPA